MTITITAHSPLSFYILLLMSVLSEAVVALYCSLLSFITRRISATNKNNSNGNFYLVNKQTVNEAHTHKINRSTKT
jgi:hypothetical protein